MQRFNQSAPECSLYFLLPTALSVGDAVFLSVSENKSLLHRFTLLITLLLNIITRFLCFGKGFFHLLYLLLFSLSSHNPSFKITRHFILHRLERKNQLFQLKRLLHSKFCNGLQILAQSHILLHKPVCYGLFLPQN